MPELRMRRDGKAVDTVWRLYCVVHSVRGYRLRGAGVSVQILIGDSLEMLRTLESDSIHCVVTSPPYWGLRDYGVVGQIGLEASPAEFIAKMVEVFEEVRRVLRPDGTCWVNMGDSYAGGGRGGNQTRATSTLEGGHDSQNASIVKRPMTVSRRRDNALIPRSDGRIKGLKPKDLVMMPHRLAIALQDAGWWVRQDIVWHKPNPMPESIKDRCTKAHEYIFLLTKSERYFFNQDAIRTPFSEETKEQSFDTMEFAARDKYRSAGNVNPPKGAVAYADGDERHRTKAGLLAYATKTRKAFKAPDGWDTGAGSHGTIHREGREKGTMAPSDYVPPSGANKRSVWTISTKAYPEAHFATFPPELPETCIKAGCPPGGLVLDPFFGAGTTGLVADRLQRDCIGIELNPAYAEIARKRIQGDSTLFSNVTVRAGRLFAQPIEATA